MKKSKFTSVFAKEIQDLVDLKRSLGFKYESGEMALRRVDRFLVENHLKEKTISKEPCDKWCLKRSHESPKTQSNRIGALRGLCQYLCDLGMKVYVPRKGIVKKGPKYAAHIYTDDELKRFFAAVDRSESVNRECPYRAAVMPVFFRILYTSGMRVSELRLVKVKDMDLEKGVITVRGAKNHKDRLVPFHPKLKAGCRELLKALHPNPDPEEYFFLLRPHTPMPLVNVYKNFRRYLENAGISHTGKGPRVHDFRHTYCVNLLRKWTEEGKDLLAYLPYLRTMLGHETFEETAYYLKLTEQMFPKIKEKLAKNLPNTFKEPEDDGSEFS